MAHRRIEEGVDHGKVVLTNDNTFEDLHDGSPAESV